MLRDIENFENEIYLDKVKMIKIIFKNDDKIINYLNKFEKNWRLYEEGQCDVGNIAYDGGTIAPRIDKFCKLNLLRQKIELLDELFHAPLHD